MGAPTLEAAACTVPELVKKRLLPVRWKLDGTERAPTNGVDAVFAHVLPHQQVLLQAG